MILLQTGTWVMYLLFVNFDPVHLFNLINYLVSISCLPEARLYLKVEIFLEEIINSGSINTYVELIANV